VVRRTSVDLDLDLLAEARSVLATRDAAETIHAALREVVRQARVGRLVGRGFPLSDDELADLRRPQTAVAPRVGVRRK
jgi:Arc/MetJ family transcription regulator